MNLADSKLRKLKSLFDYSTHFEGNAKRKIKVFLRLAVGKSKSSIELDSEILYIFNDIKRLTLLSKFNGILGERSTRKKVAG